MDDHISEALEELHIGPLLVMPELVEASLIGKTRHVVDRPA
nr:hypothetical protein [Achromobacter insolitus]